MSKKNKYYYDEKAADRAVAFIETHIRHCKGELAGKKFILEEWQKEAGDTNEGIEIDEETCAKMLPLMEKAIENKYHVQYEEEITKAIAKVEKDDNGFIKNDDEWWANYPFSADFFEEFTTFVGRCGGFTIS